MSILIVGTIAHYELCTTVEIIAVFLADKMPHNQDIMFVFYFLVEKLIGLIVKKVL
jgi:hypothetical protein